MQQYQRQILLSQIGESGQNKIVQSRVLIIGAGGLGHPAAQYLTAMGVGHLGIVDGDQIHISNLHRQVLFEAQDIGQNKAAVLAKKISKLNPLLRVDVHACYLNKELALRLFPDFDVILDCSDNFESKFLINDICVLLGKPMVYAAISQFEGSVSVFWRNHGPCYRCLYAEPPKAKIQNCAEAGVVGPLPGIVGCMQALETLKILLYNANIESDFKPLIGCLNYFNFLSNEFRSLKIKPRLNCLCQRHVFDVSEIKDIQVAQCALVGNELLLDVREQEEWNQFHILGSVHWPLSKIEKNILPELNRDKNIMLICKGGLRAEKAMSVLAKSGFINIRCSQRGVYEYQA